MTPKQYQSGETDRSGRISKRGPRMLRSMLLECAWASTRYNAWSKQTFARIHGGSATRRKKAGIALARKIAVVAWAMMRDQTDWDSTKLLLEVPPEEVEIKVKRPEIRPAAELHSAPPKTPAKRGSGKRKEASLELLKVERWSPGGQNLPFAKTTYVGCNRRGDHHGRS